MASLVAVVGLVIYKVGGVLEYRETREYKITSKGYTKEAYDVMVEKLSDANLKYILKEDRIDYIKDIIEDKYYIDENFHEYISFYEQNSKWSFSDVVALVNVGAITAWYEGAVKADTSLKEKMLVNKFNVLDDTYEPEVIKQFSSTYAYGEVSAEKTTYDAFIKMADAARKDGVTLILTSGYRTREKQTNVYEDMKSSKGEAYADEYAARPGSSEHETGLSLDILTYNAYTETFKETKAYSWLHKHAHEYGFIERYPEGKKYLTGYEAESWHYRYVGVNLAKKVKNEGITYDEYYAFYIDR